MTNVTDQIKLSLAVTYDAEDGIWVFANPRGSEPAGTAVSHIGPVTVIVSLTDPQELQRFVVVEDDLHSNDFDQSITDLIGPEATRLMWSHDLDADLGADQVTSVEWQPRRAELWSVVSRLTLLNWLEPLDDPSPWWAAEQLVLAEQLAVQCGIDVVDAVDPDRLRTTLETLLEQPIAAHQLLTGWATGINGPSGLGPVEVVEALSRLINPLDLDLGRQAAGLAATLAGPIDLASAAQFARELHEIEDQLAEAAHLLERQYLGVATDRIRVIGVSESLFTQRPVVRRRSDGSFVVSCRVIAAETPTALRGLWVRAHLGLDGVRVGRVVSLTRFDDAGLDDLAGSAPGAEFWVGDDHELVANLPLPRGLTPEDLVIEVTTNPSRQPRSQQEHDNEAARQRAREAARAARLGATDADEQVTGAAAAHLAAGNAAEHQRLLETRGYRAPDAPLGEIDDLDLVDDQSHYDSKGEQR